MFERFQNSITSIWRSIVRHCILLNCRRVTNINPQLAKLLVKPIIGVHILQESADSAAPEVGASGKDALLKDACKKYEAATRLCPSLHEVLNGIL